MRVPGLPVAIGVDVGGHGVKGVLVDFDGAVLARSRRDIEDVAGRSPDRVEALFAAVVADLRAVIGAAARDVPIGVGVPGFLDRRTRLLRASPNFPEWVDLPVAERLSGLLGAPVRVENDANCATLGEAFAGAAQGADDVALVTLGTGVGTGFLVRGRLLVGVRGAGAEGVHVVIRPGGRACGCGQRGCFETYASGPGLVRTAREEVRGTDADPHDPPSVFAASAVGEEWAARAVDRWVSDLGDGLLPLIHLLSPAKLLLSGGLAAAFPSFGPRLRAVLRERAIRACYDGVELAPGSLGPDAGAVGAAALALGFGE